MEAFGLYLLKSVIWLTGFALVFILFLRNERFFVLNRIYLLAGILTSFFFPLVSIHYTVALPLVSALQSDNAVVSEVQNTTGSTISELKLILSVLYVSGVLIVFTIIIRQGRSILRTIKKSEVTAILPVKLIRTTDYTSAFSFFSYVFVNPSITDLETREILNHEVVHIRQKHWFDLVLVELLCMMQWFNPLVWIYVRFMRQNHEYLADEVALQRTSDPAIYRAALLNQIVGAPVVSLTNSFNYSLNKKRFNMMKNIISSPYRKMKILLILPVFAIVLYAFAKPDYKYADQNSGDKPSTGSLLQNEVKGKVMAEGFALPGASVLIQNTNQGVSTNEKGFFKFDNVPVDAVLVVRCVGYKTKVMKPVFTSEMTVIMIKDTLKYSNLNLITPPPPPPPPPAMGSNSKPNMYDAPPPPPPPPLTSLVVVDGVIKDIDVNSIDPETIKSIKILKAEFAVAKYGEKAKDGVIEVTTLKKGEEKPDAEKDAFVLVEELPEFIGGKNAMAAWIISNLKYPAEAVKNKITGKVFVDFIVTASGKIRNVVVSKSVNPVLDAEAINVIGSMPDWKPGKQAGKPIPVQVQVPVEFKLK